MMRSYDDIYSTESVRPHPLRSDVSEASSGSGGGYFLADLNDEENSEQMLSMSEEESNGIGFPNKIHSSDTLDDRERDIDRLAGLVRAMDLYGINSSGKKKVSFAALDRLSKAKSTETLSGRPPAHPNPRSGSSEMLQYLATNPTAVKRTRHGSLDYYNVPADGEGDARPMRRARKIKSLNSLDETLVAEDVIGYGDMETVTYRVSTI